MTALYVTARTSDDKTIQLDLQSARRQVNTTLASLVTWPGKAADGYIFQSNSLFTAMLEQRRARMTSASGTADTDVWVREVLFYTDLIDVFYGWLAAGTGQGTWAGDVGPWLLAYRQLLGCVNSLGTEQALCSVYHAVVCFGHRETMFYLNYTFSAETSFRLYRHSYPSLRLQGNDDNSAWHLRDHHDLFPTLATCRRDVISDMEYIYSLGTVYQTSLCDYARRNNTRCVDVTRMLEEESSTLVTLIRSAVDSAMTTARWRYLQWLCVLTIIVLYSLTGTLCTARRLCWRVSRRKRRHLKFHEYATSDDQNGGCQQQQQHSAISDDTELDVQPLPLQFLHCPTNNGHRTSNSSRSSTAAENHIHNHSNHHRNGDVHIVPSSYLHRHQVSNCVTPANTLPLQQTHNGGCNSLARIKVATV
jgi:hypothetical protein